MALAVSGVEAIMQGTGRKLVLWVHTGLKFVESLVLGEVAEEEDGGVRQWIEMVGLVGYDHWFVFWRGRFEPLWWRRDR